MKLFYFLGMFVAFTIQAVPVSFQSGERQTVLVELYTSEGCSSCPPAEAWLSRQKAAPDLWNDFVPVAFHVEYWDHLGWRDKWSDKKYSERQRAYADSWGSDGVYTPEFVVNGREWRDWFGEKTVRPPSNLKAGILQINSDDGVRWKASFVPAASGVSKCEVNVALLDSEVSSDVKAGENSGRHLKHDFAALTFVKHPLAGGNGGFQGEFTLDTNPTAAHGRLALAVWATRAGELEPLQATGGWLPEPGKN